MSSSSSIRVRNGRCYVLACMMTVLIAGHLRAEMEQAADPTLPTVTKEELTPGGPYCGLYCLYSAMRLSGNGTDFTELLEPEYVGSADGSSLAELKRAADDHGLHTALVGRMTSRMLHRCPYRIILHVKSQLNSTTHDHYELFLGVERGKARLLNPPEPVKLVPFHELAPRWGGNGLVISAVPVAPDALFGAEWERIMLYAAMGVAVSLAFHLTRRYWLARLSDLPLRSRLGLSVAQAAVFGLVALFGGMIYHLANNAGFLAYPSAAAGVQHAHMDHFVPKVGEKKVHRLLDADAVFVDARMAQDFEADHFEGAINVPVNADERQRRTITSEMEQDVRVVVYSQSAQCRFAENVALKLMSDGFSNVAVFKGGVVEWLRKNGTSRFFIRKRRAPQKTSSEVQPAERRPTAST